MAPIKLRRQTADGTYIDFEGDANDYAVVYSVHGADPMMVMLQQTLFAETLQARLMPPTPPALPPAYQAQHFLPPAHDYPAASPVAVSSPPPTALAPTELVAQDAVTPTVRMARPRFNPSWTDFILPAILFCTIVGIVTAVRYKQEHPQTGTTGDKKTQTAPAKPAEKPKSDNNVQPFPFALPK